jgi:hypothetical protein
MTVSYFTHVRCLGDGSADDPYRSNFEFLPEIDALLMFINNRAACVDLNQAPIEENIGKPRWLNTRIIARNKHIAVIVTESEEEDFANQVNTFTSERPTRPYGFEFEEYRNNVITHREWLINKITNLDNSFNANDILAYISSFNFTDANYASVQQWMLDILNGGNPTYPDVLSSNNLWLFSGLNGFYETWILEDSSAEINRIFNAFEIYNMDCILEVF